MNGETNPAESAIPIAGGPPPSGIEKRKFPRFNYSVPVFVRVLVEEDTFNPMRFTGRSRNVSSGGMLVEVEGLSESDYSTLIRRQRMVRIHTQIPEVGSEIAFFGRIVWYDFRRMDRVASCLLGVSFEPLQEKEQAALDALLSQLESAFRTPLPSDA